MKNIGAKETHYVSSTLLALLIALPSLTFVEKRLGLTATLGYAAVVSLMLPVIIEKYIQELARGTTPKGMMLLLLAGIALLWSAFQVGYPIANSGRFGPGSDRDEALNQAVAALLAGDYPYYQKTYLGNPISPMPGSLILASPFYFMFGNASYQNIFWIGVFSIILIGKKSSSPSPSLIVFGLSWVLSPVLAQEFLTGGDLLANSLFVAASAYWAIDSMSSPRRGAFEMAAASMLLGICLSSRANFITIAPIIFFTIARRNNYSTAMIYGTLSALTLIILTGFFYLHDPAAFSPLHTANKLAKFNDVLPHAVLVIPIITFAASMAFGLYGDVKNTYMHMALVLAIPVIASILLQSIQSHLPTFSAADFALPSLIFGILGHRTIRSCDKLRGGSPDRPVGPH